MTRTVLVGAAILAVLLLGASAGLGLAMLGRDEPEPGPVAIGFAQDMSVHHRQAARMAELARDSDDPEITGLAYDIQTTQLAQIGRMQGWLALWGAPSLPPGGRHMAWMDGMGHGGGVEVMPGMASPAEMARLRQATGRELEVLFLQLMLRHHQSGVTMARYAAKHADIPQVANLARQMASAQAKEITYMKQLLAQRGAAPLPAPG